jgi:hypothetical protein
VDRTLAFVVCLAASFPVGAMAGCGGQIAGPISDKSPYYYASSCFSLPNQVMLRHEVCSVSPATLMFKWTKLNWVSGSEGVEYGGCLVRTNVYSSALRVGGSMISTNVGQAYNTDVYLPDLKDGNNQYFETVDGGGPRISGGNKQAFHFEIRYLRRGDKIEIHAAMSGKNPVFFLVLPPSIKSSNDLKNYIADDYLKQISPLVDFGGKALSAKIKSDDILLAEFFKENEVASRGSIAVQGETTTLIDFAVIGELPQVLSQLAICLGQLEAVSTCFQAGSPQ